MKKLTKTAITAATMATMTLGTVVSVSADNPKNAWVGSGTNYEYYNGNGKKVQNAWVKAGEKWYFLDEDGKMATKSFIRTDAFTDESEVLDDNDIHDLLEQDDIDDDSKFYYVDASGAMVTGWQAIDASSVYLSPNSTKNGKIWYYFGTSGVMYTDAWILAGENWYAVGSNGQMLTNRLVDEDIEKATGKKYFVDKDGKMITGWYKTTKDDIRSKTEEEDKGKFSKDGLYIYAYEDGSLASNEWVHTNSGWYYLGSAHWPAGHEEDSFELIVWNADDDELDKLYKESNIPNSISDLLERPELNQDIDLENDAKENDRDYAMLSNKLIQWTNHDKKDTKYFYLQKEGAMLTDWYEYQDDYYLCANSDGELYEDGVESVKGKYYYFNRNAVCDYKYLNVVADYAVKLPGGDYAFYNTDGKRTDVDLKDLTHIKVSEMKDALKKESYQFGNRTVKISSMTDMEVVFAYAAEQNDTFGAEITVYKLRSSSKTTATVKNDEFAHMYIVLDNLSPEITFDLPKNAGGAIQAENVVVSGSAVTVDKTFSKDALVASKEISITGTETGTDRLTVDLTADLYAELKKNIPDGAKKIKYGATIEFTLGSGVSLTEKSKSSGTTATIDGNQVTLEGSGTYTFTATASEDGKTKVTREVKITIP